jgi:hypothetical protein
MKEKAVKVILNLKKVKPLKLINKSLMDIYEEDRHPEYEGDPVIYGTF